MTLTRNTTEKHESAIVSSTSSARQALVDYMLTPLWHWFFTGLCSGIECKVGKATKYTSRACKVHYRLICIIHTLSLIARQVSYPEY